MHVLAPWINIESNYLFFHLFWSIHNNLGGHMNFSFFQGFLKLWQNSDKTLTNSNKTLTKLWQTLTNSNKTLTNSDKLWQTLTNSNKTLTKLWQTLTNSNKTMTNSESISKIKEFLKPLNQDFIKSFCHGSPDNLLPTNQLLTYPKTYLDMCNQLYSVSLINFGPTTQNNKPWFWIVLNMKSSECPNVYYTE